MNKTIARGFVVTLLIAAGCDSGGNDSGTGGRGGGAGSTGGTGAAGRGGTSGGGTSGGGTTGGGGAGTGVAGTSGGGTSGGGSGGGAGGGGTSGGGSGGSVGGAGAGGTSSAGSGGGGSGGAGGTGGGVGGTAWLTPPPNMPPALAVPAGATVKVHVHAVGDQIYTCTASGSGGAGGSGGGGGATTYAWTLKAPDAKLYDQANVQVGTHGAGPNWTSSDGSVVNAARATQVNAPIATAIPWLLLRATSNTGTGVYGDVTYIQRVDTTGGRAPATGCDAGTVGTDTRVAYTAEYFLYSGGAGAAWLTPPANLPAAIAVPSGAMVKLHQHAVGVQIYTCTASSVGGAGGGGGSGGGGGGATTYAWVLKAPDAILYDATFTQVGTHGAGPNWTSSDGSVVNAARIAQASASVAGAVAWLLLGTTSTTGTGVFSDITYVQRLNTAGGVAPATGCDVGTVSTDVRVDYSTDYYFFTGGAADGGTNG